jgi:hypothetical protein
VLLPDGYSDVPAGKVAAVVTDLEMTKRPVLRRDLEGHGRCGGSNIPISIGSANFTFALARNGSGSRVFACPTLSLPRSFTRFWWKCMHWYTKAATRACSNWTFEPADNANSPSSD